MFVWISKSSCKLGKRLSIFDVQLIEYFFSILMVRIVFENSENNVRAAGGVVRTKHFLVVSNIAVY